MNFGLIIIGDEILSGKRADKHLPKAIELLAARGLSLAWARYVGDDPERITADLRDAFDAARRGDVVFSCGGIGATPDDHTRQCAARALGVPLALHPQAAELIRERMRDVAREQGTPYEPDRADNVHRLNMGVFPEGARLIPNPYNKIAGFSLHPGGRAPAATASRCRSWLPSRHCKAPSAAWQRRSTASESGPRLTRSPRSRAVSRLAEKPMCASRRSSAPSQPCRSPMQYSAIVSSFPWDP